MKAYSVIKAAEILGVCRKTIKNWIYTGKLKTFLTPNKYHRIPETEINKILNNQENKAIIYSRVSSTKQKQDLQRQHQRLQQYCQEHNYQIQAEYSEIASGLNDKRTKLLKALEQIKQGKANKIIIEHKDRLTRFGYNYLEIYINTFGATIEPINNNEIQDDIIKDLIDIITCFCAKLYGRRSKKQITEKTIQCLNQLK